MSVSEGGTMGSAIEKTNTGISVPDDPIINYIEGDGIGADITPVMKKVVDASVRLAYAETKKIFWNEVLAGQKAFDSTGEWLPEETLRSMRKDSFP